jgi:chromosomal replication initiator protein
VRQQIGARAFDQWLGGVEGRVEGDVLVLDCPDAFVRSWVQGRYGDMIRDASPVASVEYRVPGRSAERPAPSEPEAPGEPLAPVAPVQSSFDSFIAGPANALALEAARAVARGEAGRCNPLVLTGPSGVGKTHLCQSIRSGAGANAVYRSCEEFTSEVTQAIRGDRMPAIRHRYRRNANLLILEDLQFLEGKKATQVEFFHTLDHLLERGRPVVVTADRSPHELGGLDPKLASRLASGLVAYIGPPEADTRLAILRAKSAAGGVRVPDDCLELLATRPVTSVRDLLAGLNQVVARATLLKRAITAELVQEALAASVVPGAHWTLDEIIALVARTYSVTPDDLRSRTRKRHIARPRQIAMYLCRRYTDASLKEIGRTLQRDHTSVLYAIDAVERRTLEHPQLRYQLETLSARLA